MAWSSLTYVEAFCKRGQKTLPKKAIRWLFCISTTPMADLEASVSSIKGSLKSGNARTGASIKGMLSHGTTLKLILSKKKIERGNNGCITLDEFPIETSQP